MRLWFQRLKLRAKYRKLPLNEALKFNLRRYIMGGGGLAKTPQSSGRSPASLDVSGNGIDVGSPGCGAAAGAAADAAAGVNLPAVLRRRCDDDKASVRKSAVAALEAVVTALADPVDGPSAEDLSALARACSDNLVSVRRQGMQSLSSLIAAFPVGFSVSDQADQADSLLHAMLSFRSVTTSMRHRRILFHNGRNRLEHYLLV